MTELQNWSDEDDEKLNRLLFKLLSFQLSHKVRGPLCRMRGLLLHFKEADGSMSAANVARMESEAAEMDLESRILSANLDAAERTTLDGVENEKQQ